MWARFFSNYGMLVVLAGLCAFLTVWTIGAQYPTGPAAAAQVADVIVAETPAGATVAVIARDSAEDRAFGEMLEARLAASGRTVARRVHGEPSDGAKALRELAGAGVSLDAIALTKETGDWRIFDAVPETTRRVQPASTYGSIFLTTSNLVNITDQIAVIAILAIGMTIVIIAGGIDLSVGSLLALAAVLSTWLIREVAGRYEAGALAMAGCCAAAIAACGVIGAGTGLLVTAFRVPAFIVTLGVMLIARGAATKLTGGQTVFEVPPSFTWLGREATFGLPNAVLLMVALYLLAHMVMAHTVLGRYFYAVGGNAEAARLSGVPVGRIVVLSYLLSGTLAGLGGVITASQLKGGSPTWGATYELVVIASVVVGGTSLSGGEGRILGTLIGALLIAVINNGMNLIGLRSWDQELVLGAVIVLAVLFDRAKQLGWLRPAPGAAHEVSG